MRTKNSSDAFSQLAGCSTESLKSTFTQSLPNSKKMESQTTPQKTPTELHDSSLEDAPLLQLLDTPMHEMTPEKLRERVTQLRDITSSPITLKKSLTNKKAEEKASRSTAPKESAAALASKYLNLGKKGAI